MDGGSHPLSPLSIRGVVPPYNGFPLASSRGRKRSQFEGGVATAARSVKEVKVLRLSPNPVLQCTLFISCYVSFSCDALRIPRQVDVISPPPYSVILRQLRHRFAPFA